ncbi:hypothetical protein ACNQUF_12685, partial [Corynebacterium diphtheriae]
APPSWSLMSSPNLADTSWITRQVRPLRPRQHRLAAPDDAGVVRVDEETGMGVALAARRRRGA